MVQISAVRPVRHAAAVQARIAAVVIKPCFGRLEFLYSEASLKKVALAKVDVTGSMDIFKIAQCKFSRPEYRFPGLSKFLNGGIIPRNLLHLSI